MEFPISFTKDLARRLKLQFSKIGTDNLIGLTTMRYDAVMDSIYDYIDETQVDWEDPIEIDNDGVASIIDKQVTCLYLVCSDMDDAWELIVAESEVGTIVSANRI